MVSPKPISLTQSDTNPGSYTPKPYVVVGAIPGSVEAQAAPAIDDSPADAAAVATDLQSVVDALIAAGVFTA
jgi:hypothetical protein